MSLAGEMTFKSGQLWRSHPVEAVRGKRRLPQTVWSDGSLDQAETGEHDRPLPSPPHHALVLLLRCSPISSLTDLMNTHGHKLMFEGASECGFSRS
jgi:hypothetical protein